MLVTIYGCGRQNLDIGDIFWMLVHDANLKLYRNIGDENGENRHQHLKFVANTFHPQDPSPISM